MKTFRDRSRERKIDGFRRNRSHPPSSEPLLRLLSLFESAASPWIDSGPLKPGEDAHQTGDRPEIDLVDNFNQSASKIFVSGTFAQSMKLFDNAIPWHRPEL